MVLCKKKSCEERGFFIILMARIGFEIKEKGDWVYK